MSVGEHYSGANTSSFRFEQDFQYIAGTFEELRMRAESDEFGIVDSSVARRLMAPNPDFQPGGRYFERLGALIDQRGQVGEEQIFDLGVDIGAGVTDRANSPRTLILDYLNTCIWMYAAKVGHLGLDNTAKSKVNMLLEPYIEKPVLGSLPHTVKTMNVFSAIMGSFQNLSQMENGNDDLLEWIAARLDILYSDHRVLREFKDSTNLYYANISKSLSPEDLSEIDSHIRLLNRESMTHRKYGTKPAYTRASIGGSWIFYDGDDIRRATLEQSRFLNIPRFAALVFHSPRQDFRNLRIGLEKHYGEKTGVFRTVAGGFEGIEPDLRVFIGLDGTISLDPEGLLPIEQMMPDNPTAARMLKAELASNFYDLSMPISAEPSRRSRNYAGMTESERVDFDPVLQLLIPRIRSLGRPVPLELTYLGRSENMM